MTLEVIFELFDGAILVVMETGELGLVAIATDLLDVAMSTALVFGPLGLLISDTEGIITEEDNITSHAAVIGLRLGIPVIVGFKNATEVIREGAILTVDAKRGIVYSGTLSKR